MSKDKFDGYIRVSDVIGKFSGFAACDKCMKNSLGIDPEVLNRKCEIGTSVHEAVELYLKGIDPILSGECEPYFESFMQWHKNNPITPQKQEVRFFNERLKLTGQVDMIANGRIYDFKTSSSVSRKSWAIQAALYYLLATEAGLSIDRVVTFLHLKKDGKEAREIQFDITDTLLEVAIANVLSFRYWYVDYKSTLVVL